MTMIVTRRALGALALGAITFHLGTAPASAED